MLLKDGLLTLDPLDLGVAGGKVAGAIRIDAAQTNGALWLEAEAAQQWMGTASGDDIAANRAAVMERGRSQVV